MALKTYFEQASGRGVLATADAEGNVDAAIYARPHVQDDLTVSFIMAERRSYRNVVANPHAVFLFLEGGDGYEGKRLHLTRIADETDADKIDELRRRCSRDTDSDDTRHLVTFRVDEIRPLVGEYAS